VVIHHARLSIDGDLFTPYEVIGELGKRAVPVYVARQSALAVGGAQLVVAEHFPGACKTGDAAARTDLRREARRISTLANPHLARVREVAVRGDDLVVFGDFIDGEKLGHFWESGEWLPLEIALRVLLDVLTGASALHGLRDSNQQPMKLTHGEISPSTILLGSDGVARVLHAVARRAPDASAEAASLPYLAPEVHTSDARDGRADVFSIGVLLWEVLEGRRLSEEGQEAPGLRVRSAPIPLPSTPEKAPWARALAPVAAKALAAAPEDRWATAAAMAAEIRKAAGLKLAAASAASAFAKSKFGDRVKERRARWEARPSRPPVSVASPRPAAAAPPGAPPVAESPSRVLAPAALAGVASVQVPELPFGRSEEFSSSILESYRPPPPLRPSVEPGVEPGVAEARPQQRPAPEEAPPSLSASIPQPPSSTKMVVPFEAPVPQPPASTKMVVPFEAPVPQPPASAEMVAPFEAPVPQPPSSAEIAVPFEAPVVFGEVEAGPVASPFSDPSPMPPALSTSGAPTGSRRRHLLLGGVAALGIAAVSLGAVRVAQHGAAPAVAAAAMVAPLAAPAAAAVSASSVAAAAPPPSTPAAASAPSVSPGAPAAHAPSPAAHAASPKAKGGPKTKTPGAPGSHPKSGTVRPQTRPKPAST
jgi:serine/threonine protein kinase